MQEILEHKVNKLVKEITDAFELRFEELSLIDEETQSRIDDVYLKDKVILPNEVRNRKGLAPLEGGDEPLELKPQQEAEIRMKGNRERDQRRQVNAPDKMGTARNAQGEGRKQA
jgi:hypothetical protein